jgi:hypothetical protein
MQGLGLLLLVVGGTFVLEGALFVGLVLGVAGFHLITKPTLGPR